MRPASRPRLVALFAVAACATQPVAPPSAPAPSGPGLVSFQVSEGTGLSFDVAPDGTIVFDLLGQLWRMPAGGGEARAITDAVRDTAEDLDPSWSPDARRIVFRAERRGRTGLWLLEPGGEPRQLTQLADPDGFEGQAAWSPDGRTIAFVRIVLPEGPGDSHTRLALLDPATGSVRALDLAGFDSTDVADPAWDHEGKQLAFVARDATGGEGGRIWLANPETGSAAPFGDSAIRAIAPAFSPDGARLAWLGPDSAGRLQVWVRNLASASSRARRLTSHEDVTRSRVRWARGGASLFYVADGRLRRVPADGGAPTEVPFTARIAFTRARPSLPRAPFAEPGVPRAARGFTGLALSPDARQIAILALGKLWVVPVGGAPRAVAPVPHTARQLSWSADMGAVAWTAGEWDEEDLYATDLSTGTTRRLTALPGREVYPAYSPDGRHLAFVHVDRANGRRIRLVAPDSVDVADTARTRDLGRTFVDWLASGTATPQWSPASDAVFQLTGGWSGRRPTTAMLIPLAGGSRPQRVPDSPVAPALVDGGMVFVRHARLWRVAFDSGGMAGEPEPLGDAPAAYPSVARDGTILYVSEGGLRLRAPDGVERRLGWPLEFTPPVAEPLLIRSVHVIDGTGSPATPPRDLLIEGGRIARIAEPGTVRASGMREIDGRGGHVMPGLMDLHAHVYERHLLPGALYFGVMTIRDQGSSTASLVAGADAIAAGVFDGPRVGYGGIQYYSDWAFDDEGGQGVEPEADPQHAARAVALADIFGAQHIKTRTFRRWDIDARFVAEAHRRGMRVTGHCAHLLPLAAAGIEAKEHIGYCGARGEMRYYDDLIQLYRAAGIAVVPTISYPALAARFDRADLFAADSELAAFMPPIDNWMIELDSTERRDFARQAAEWRNTTARLARAGVTIGAGTDVWEIPTAVHMELEELVAAGLSPLDAIRSATGDAARILGAERDLGTIEVGKVADLVLLDADPLADIRNTRRITAVIQAGRIVDRAALREQYGRPPTKRPAPM